MNISGPLSQLYKGLDRDKIPMESFIGLPINDSNGNKIGAITSVDFKRDSWNGYLEWDALDSFKEPKEISMEINPAVKHKEKLIQEIKLLGQELIDRAEDIAGSDDLRTSLIVMLTFENESAPTIECTSTYLSKRYIDNIASSIPSSISQSGIPANAIRESLGFKPIENNKESVLPNGIPNIWG